MSYKTYEEYKDSGVEWVDLVPNHWDSCKIKFLGNFQNGFGFPEKFQGNGEGDIPFLKVSDINDYINIFVDSGNNYVDFNLVNSNKWKKVPVNSILFPKIGVALLKNHRKINKTEVIIDNNMSAITPNDKIYFKYLFYIFKELDMKDFVNVSAIPSINFSLLKNFEFPISFDYDEQKQISDYLDKKTSEIDENIAKNKEIINLLEEKKAALINQAVTKGLNPNVFMKDSGIEWIGEIPEHWNVNKLKEISEIKPSNVDKKSKEGEPSVFLCNYTDVYNNDYITNNLDFMEATASYDQINKLSLKKENIIITKDSESADDIGVPAIVTEDLDNVVCGYHLAVIRPNENIHGKFLFRSFESKKINDQFCIAANGITRFGLSLYPIKNAYVCVPPLDEQKEISTYLENEIINIHEIINKIEKQIELLEEYKSSLIHHVVTGKIDVREEEI